MGTVKELKDREWFSYFLFALWPSRQCCEFMNIRFSVNIASLMLREQTKNVFFYIFSKPAAAHAVTTPANDPLAQCQTQAEKSEKKIEIVYTRTQHGEILERRSNVEREERRKKFCLPSREGGEDGERAKKI